MSSYDKLTTPAIGFEIADISADDHDFTTPTRGISFAAAGDLAIVTEDGTTAIVPSGALAAGIVHPIRAATITKTGTTATGIVGWY